MQAVSQPLQLLTRPLFLNQPAILIDGTGVGEFRLPGEQLRDGDVRLLRHGNGVDGARLRFEGQDCLVYLPLREVAGSEMIGADPLRDDIDQCRVDEEGTKEGG